MSRSASLAAAVFIAVIFLSFAASARAECGSALCPDEELHYALRWGVFPVGSAELITIPRETDCLHSVVARSNMIVDMVAMVRDEIVARADCATGLPLHYAKSLREGDVRRRFTVRFENGLSTRVEEPGGPTRTLQVDAARDPVSILFAFRNSAAEGARDATVSPVTDGKVLTDAKAEFVGRERLHFGGVFLATQVFDVYLGNVDGFFRMAAGQPMRIWVTDDASRIPLRIQAKVIVAGFEGEFTGALTRAVRNGEVVLVF